MTVYALVNNSRVASVVFNSFLLTLPNPHTPHPSHSPTSTSYFTPSSPSHTPSFSHYHIPSSPPSPYHTLSSPVTPSSPLSPYHPLPCYTLPLTLSLPPLTLRRFEPQLLECALFSQLGVTQPYSVTIHKAVILMMVRLLPLLQKPWSMQSVVSLHAVVAYTVLQFIH